MPDNNVLGYRLASDNWCNCTSNKEGNCPGISASSDVAERQPGHALELRYDLGKVTDCWTQANCEFNPPLDLSAYDHLAIDWLGDPKSGNSLEVGLISGGITSIRHYDHVTQKSWWSPLVIPFNHFENRADLKNVTKIFISVKKSPKAKDLDEDVGGAGTITIDYLRVLNISSRRVPSNFKKAIENKSASKLAANWLASQQQTSGLLKSWAEEKDPNSYAYDQALALIVFSQEGMWDNADRLMEAIIDLQNKDDGSWYENYNYNNMKNTSSQKWMGSISWLTFALDRYRSLGGIYSCITGAGCSRANRQCR